MLAVSALCGDKQGKEARERSKTKEWSKGVEQGSEARRGRGEDEADGLELS